MYEYKVQSDIFKCLFVYKGYYDLMIVRIYLILSFIPSICASLSFVCSLVHLLICFFLLFFLSFSFVPLFIRCVRYR